MAKAKKAEAPQEEAGLLDVTFDGIPGADKLTEKDAAPFVEDLSFDLDLEGNPKEEDNEEVEEDTTEQAEGDEPEEEAPAEVEEAPKDGDEGGESAEEPVEEEVAAEADESEIEGKKKLMVPKSRLDEVLAKQKALQKQLNEQMAKEAEVQAEAPKYEFDTKEAEYQQLVLDGESEKATALRTEIRNAEREQTMFEVQQKMGQTVQQSQEAIQLQTTAELIQEQYPILDENSQDYNKEMADEVIDLRDAFIVQGYQASDALTKATKYVVAGNEPLVEATSSLKKGNGEIAQKKKKATVQKKIEASESQPPDLKGQGNAERGEGTLDVNALSEDEFNALPEETLRRLRGDFG
ncbi:MAG TPA: hypothetical protein DHN29_10830 [Cytophagales bacterium]|nr:hypothetical protein [Cytophagales bacterium]|tara:strand:- start:55 stop:1107 length:1053 start_codon:yes stop_codon:yes gene_type:complete